MPEPLDLEMQAVIAMVPAHEYVTRADLAHRVARFLGCPSMQAHRMVERADRLGLLETTPRDGGVRLVYREHAELSR